MANTTPSPNADSWFSKSHKNRLGAVFQACSLFLSHREKYKPWNKDEETPDLYSMIKFSSKATVVFQNKSSISEQFLFDKVSKIQPEGKTYYQFALEAILSNDLIDTTRDCMNVILFLSDGEDLGTREAINTNLNKIMDLPCAVVLHTVLLGTSQEGKKLLEYMALRGGGQFFETGEGLAELLASFELIAARFVK